MNADDDLVLIRRGDLAYAMRKADPLHPLGDDECAARDRLLAVAGSAAPCRSCASCERELSAVRLELQAAVRERDQYRDALREIADPPGPYGGADDIEEARRIARAALGRERKDQNA